MCLIPYRIRTCKLQFFKKKKNQNQIKRESMKILTFFFLLFYFLFTDQSHLNLFATRPQPKKKRKSRTAFTNNQIFELEKRFIYQKYLSPADRDEIAASLGLSNAQVKHLNEFSKLNCLLVSLFSVKKALKFTQIFRIFPFHFSAPGYHMVPKSSSKIKTRHGRIEKRRRNGKSSNRTQKFPRKC